MRSTGFNAILLVLVVALAGCAGAPPVAEAPVTHQARDKLTITATAADISIVEVPPRPKAVPLSAGAPAPVDLIAYRADQAKALQAHLVALTANTKIAHKLVEAAREAETERNQLVVVAQRLEDRSNFMARKWAESENQRAAEARAADFRDLVNRVIQAALAIAGFAL